MTIGYLYFYFLPHSWLSLCDFFPEDGSVERQKDIGGLLDLTSPGLSPDLSLSDRFLINFV